LAAVDALGKLNDIAASPALLGALRDPNSHVKWAAINALARLADPSTVSDLIDCLNDTDGPYWEAQRVCDVAAEALERIGTPQAKEAVTQWRFNQANPK
jgi:HEAT repeat protein